MVFRKALLVVILQRFRAIELYSFYSTSRSPSPITVGYSSAYFGLGCSQIPYLKQKTPKYFEQ